MTADLRRRLDSPLDILPAIVDGIALETLVRSR
jgi:hypothetical protein